MLSGPALQLAGGARVGVELSEDTVSDMPASCVGIWVCEFCGGESSEEMKAKTGRKKERKEERKQEKRKFLSQGLSVR